MNDVEEGAELVHLVELTRQSGGQVEAEPVDVHLSDPVAQRVHDELENRRRAHEQRVAGTGGVEVVAGRSIDEAVVGAVVDASEGQRGAQVVALGRVVVDHVQDDLDVGLVEGLDHGLELLDLLTLGAVGGVGVVRGEESDRVVAPVVRQALLLQVGVVDELVDRHELDSRRTQVLEVVDDGGLCQTGVGAPQVLGNHRVQLGHALDVGLVDDRLVVLVVRGTVVAPVEVGVDDH